MKKTTLLGILGGLGPMSTVYFCELLCLHTKAECDRDHIDMLVSSRATTPDRTAFILDNTMEDPLPVMIEEAHRLERAGVDLLVIPCNTAHYFYDGLSAACHTPILNIIRETVAHLHRCGIQRMGLLATDGTVRSRAYLRICKEYGMECITPSDGEQDVIMSVIYDQIKQNKAPDIPAFLRVADSLRERGCEKLVLGCTELSLLKKSLPNADIFTDSLEVLAYRTIQSCNKTPIDFPKEFEVTE